MTDPIGLEAGVDVANIRSLEDLRQTLTDCRWVLISTTSRYEVWGHRNTPDKVIVPTDRQAGDFASLYDQAVRRLAPDPTRAPLFPEQDEAICPECEAHIRARMSDAPHPVLTLLIDEAAAVEFFARADYEASQARLQAHYPGSFAVQPWAELPDSERERRRLSAAHDHRAVLDGLRALCAE